MSALAASQHGEEAKSPGAENWSAGDDLPEANSLAKSPIPGIPRFYAFCAGHTEPRFQQDVLRLGAELEMCNYEVVMRPGATCGDVVQGARDLVDKTLEKDVVLFYVSTYGSNPDKHEGKLLLSFDDGLLDVKDFMGELEKLSSTKVMILIHSCFAGAALLSHETNGGDMPTNDITHSLNYELSQIRPYISTGLKQYRVLWALHKVNHMSFTLKGFCRVQTCSKF